MGLRERTARRELELKLIESEYKKALVSALEECANGRWGLFRQNAGTLPTQIEERLMPETVKRLDEIGESWKRLAAEAGYSEPFPLMQLFEKHQGKPNANGIGEARLAQKLLAEIHETQP